MKIEIMVDGLKCQAETDYDHLLKEVMATVRKAWVFGRDTGYREARDARNG